MKHATALAIVWGLGAGINGALFGNAMKELLAEPPGWYWGVWWAVVAFLACCTLICVVGCVSNLFLGTVGRAAAKHTLTPRGEANLKEVVDREAAMKDPRKKPKHIN